MTAGLLGPSGTDTPLRVYRLRFPRFADVAGVRAFLGAISGLRPPTWQWLWHRPVVSFEVHADHRGIQHLLLVPTHLAPTIEAALTAHLPNVRYEVDTGHQRPLINEAGEYRLTTGARPLHADATVLGPQLLASLQPLGMHEGLTVQIMVTPARAVRPARVATAHERDGWFSFDDEVVATSEAATSLKKKQAWPLLLATARIGVTAASPTRRRQLRARVENTWRSMDAPGVAVRRLGRFSSRAGHRLAELRSPALGWPCLFNTDELTSLLGLPLGDGPLPGVSTGGCPPLVVPTDVMSHGTVIGDGTHPRTRRPAALDFEARRHHTLVVGPTGSGKSVLLTQLALGDVTGNHSGLFVLDPKDGELIASIASRLPEDRLEDVVIVDPTDTHPVGIDPLRANDATRELVVDRVLGLMVDIWGSNIGPRSFDILRHLLLTISIDPTLTLVEAPHLLVDRAFRRRVVSRLNRRDLTGWWAWFESLGEAQQATVTAAPLNKLRSFVGRSVVANMLGQADPKLDLARQLNGGGIVLIRLPVGLLGEDTTSLLGGLLVTQLWQAVAGRASIEPARRRHANIVLDEVGTILRFPSGSVESLLTQARGYGVGATLAAQHLGQLSRSVTQTVLANARTTIAFAVSHADATILSKEFGGAPKPSEITDLDPYEAVAAIYAQGRTRSPATIATRALSEPTRPAEAVLDQSRQRWGTEQSDIVRVHEARLEAPSETSSGSIGRQRRRTS